MVILFNVNNLQGVSSQNVSSISTAIPQKFEHKPDKKKVEHVCAANIIN